MKKLNYLFLVMLMILSVSITSCSSDDDEPIIPEDPAIEFPAGNTTISQVKAMATGEDGIGVEITSDVIITGTVVTNPAALNLPKGLFIQSGNEAVKISVDDGGATFNSLQVGQKVALKAQGLFIGEHYDVKVIGLGADDKYKVGLIDDAKLKEVLVLDADVIEEVTPKVVTIEELSNPVAMVGTVVSIQGVQFVENDKATTYYNGENSYASTTLTDANGDKIVISTYKTATFGTETVKGDKSGTVTAVLSIYSGKPQLILRSVDDLNFAEDRFEEPGEPNATTDEKVFFSEYAEGSSNNKYIEIYNGTDGSIDLSNYTVRTGSNGGDWSDAIELTGTLEAGAVYVIGTDELDASISENANLQLAYPSPVHFNGDDAVGLFKKVAEGWSLCDVIGVQGTQEIWAVGDVSEATKDHTLLRKESVTTGNPDWSSAADEWDVMEKDYWGSMGIIGQGSGAPAYNFVDKTVDDMDESFDLGTTDARVDVEGWYTEVVEGGLQWKIKEYNSDKYLSIAGYNSGEDAIEAWIVTPGLNLDAANSFKNLSFSSKTAYSKAETLTVLVSTNFDYNSGVAAATWEELTVDLAPETTSGYSEWTSSNVIDLSGKTGVVHVAFKYVGNQSDATGTWQLDNAKFNYDASGNGGGETNEGVNQGDATVSGASDLFISEYIEGGSSNKYLEIFNGTGADVDLTNYSIKVGSNGKMFADATDIPLSGTLPNGATFVIANTGAEITPEGVSASLDYSTATYFNGDDAVALLKSGNVIDVVGVEGEDPGDGWTIGDVTNATKDHTLVRKSSVSAPVTTWDTAEWEVKDKDDATNLGSHTMN